MNIKKKMSLNYWGPYNCFKNKYNLQDVVSGIFDYFFCSILYTQEYHIFLYCTDKMFKRSIYRLFLEKSLKYKKIGKRYILKIIDHIKYVYYIIIIIYHHHYYSHHYVIKSSSSSC